MVVTVSVLFDVQNQRALDDFPSAIEAVQHRLNRWEETPSPKSDSILYAIKKELTDLVYAWERYCSQETALFASLIDTELDTLNRRIEQNLDHVILTRVHGQAQAERSENNRRKTPAPPASLSPPLVSNHV